MALSHSQFKLELIKVPPLVLYNIATDIQISKKWKDFAYNIGFTAQNVILIEESRGDRFPAENVLYHWYCKNPKLSDLIDVLLKLDLETPLFKIKNIVHPDAWKEIESKITMRRKSFEDSYTLSTAVPDTAISTNNVYSKPLKPSNSNSVLTSVSENENDITAAEAGMVDIEVHGGSIARSSFQKVISICSNQESKEYSQSCPFKSYILTLLEFRCLKFDSTELKLSSVNLKSDRFSTTFNKTIRSIKFEIRAFSLKKILRKSKLQLELMNIIWSETSFRFSNLPLLVGYSFADDFLYLIYKDNGSNSLFNLLHRSPINSSKSNDANLSIYDRLLIVKSVGDALSFMHNTIPFGAYHGSVASLNIFVSNHQVSLGNLNNFYTENPNYLKLRELITQPKTDIKSLIQEQSSVVISSVIEKEQPKRSQALQSDVEKRCRSDIKQFIELICEVFWNIQQDKRVYKDGDDYDSENDEASEEEQTLSEFVIKHNQRPLIEYYGWSEMINKELCELMQKADDKQISIAEILEDLDVISDKIQKDQSSPPPYEYSNVDTFTDKVDT